MLTSAPDDYGLTPDATIAMTVEPMIPPDFEDFWMRLREELAPVRPRFAGAIDDPINPVVYESLRHVRIAGRLTRPEGNVRAVVVTSHGYAVDGDWAPEPEDWLDRGLAVLRIRIRGYPPSTMDVPDLREQWILHRLADASQWILRGGVADLIQAVRCVREALPSVPIHVHGESFGGGLAVIAAAQLSEMGVSVDRLAIGLPSLGAWEWRRRRYCNGSGGEVRMMLDAMREETMAMERALSLFDAVAHARHVAIPTLAKLAERDDVVPAPSAAAIFNAIGATWKRAIRVPYGHFDGGLANARRHVEHARVAAAFLDPSTPLDSIGG